MFNHSIKLFFKKSPQVAQNTRICFPFQIAANGRLTFHWASTPTWTILRLTVQTRDSIITITGRHKSILRTSSRSPSPNVTNRYFLRLQDRHHRTLQIDPSKVFKIAITFTALRKIIIIEKLNAVTRLGVKKPTDGATHIEAQIRGKSHLKLQWVKQTTHKIIKIGHWYILHYSIKGAGMFKTKITLNT